MVGSCVFCAPQSVGKCFSLIHFQPADYSGVLTLFFRVSDTCVLQDISTSVSSAILRFFFLGFFFVPALLPSSLEESLQFNSTIFRSDCTNTSGGGGWGGRASTTWTNYQAPGVLLGCYYGGTSLHTSCTDQNKAGHLVLT